MSTLYKRYIPPKSAITPAPAPAPSTALTQQSPSEPERNRKRERTQDEVAERKAKKLKKKGIDPATVPAPSTSTPIETEGDVATHQSIPETSDQATPDAARDFSHIKNAKKRHKLEKEARKARKAAETGQEATQEGAPRPSQIVEKAIASGSHAAAVLPASHSEALEDDNAAERPQTKKRRHKLESVLEDRQSKATLEGATADDAQARKHFNVLSKFQKSAQPVNDDAEDEEASDETGPAQTVVQHLSLPEPDQSQAAGEDSEYCILPTWLAKPTVVSAESKATFSDMGLKESVVDLMAELGFREALPVQQALVPLLLPPGEPGSSYLPGMEERMPDLAVSAPTGSGKTISYLLPIIQALQQSSHRGRLRALIIVPTRELALQVDAVAKALSVRSDVKTEHIGNRTIKDEQQKLIHRGRMYDPEECQRRLAVAKSRIDGLDHSQGDAREDARIEDTVAEIIAGFDDHIPTYDSAIDLLVATPGRLIEHLNNTNGFALVDVQWLVIDEADKLLDNQQQQLLDELQKELTRSKFEDEQDPRERYLRAHACWDERRERFLRKVVLSATMTKDISKLSALRLRRPKLVVVRGAHDQDEQAAPGAEGMRDGETGSVRQRPDGFELPPTLIEYAVPVGDGSEKPLVAIELLCSRILPDQDSTTTEKDTASSETDDSDTDDSDESSSVSSVSSDSSSDDENSDEGSDEGDEDDAPGKATKNYALDLPIRTSKQSVHAGAGESGATTVLIFTSSNESAIRLAHLLKALKPAWSKYVTAMVKSSKAHIRSKRDELAIVVSTDRASRGLDAIRGRPITHVVQYDVPRSLTSYIHRVGRTARAGKPGIAWTLFTHREGKWFTQEIIQAPSVTRSHMVERVKMRSEDAGLKMNYEAALNDMREEVHTRV